MQFSENTEITGRLTGSGIIRNAASLIFDGAVSNKQIIEMDRSDVTIQVEHEFHATVAGFDQSGASITLNTAGHGAYSFVYTANEQATGGTLEIDRGAQHYDLNLLGSYSQSGFHADVLNPRLGSGLVLTYSAPN